MARGTTATWMMLVSRPYSVGVGGEDAAPVRPLGQTIEQVVGAAVMEPVHDHGITSMVSLPALVGDGD
jgi:hypothetical protein